MVHPVSGTLIPSTSIVHISRPGKSILLLTPFTCKKGSLTSSLISNKIVYLQRGLLCPAGQWTDPTPNEVVSGLVLLSYLAGSQSSTYSFRSSETLFPSSAPLSRQPALLAARSNRKIRQNDRDNPSRLQLPRKLSVSLTCCGLLGAVSRQFHPFQCCFLPNAACCVTFSPSYIQSMDRPCDPIGTQSKTRSRVLDLSSRTSTAGSYAYASWLPRYRIGGIASCDPVLQLLFRQLPSVPSHPYITL